MQLDLRRLRPYPWHVIVPVIVYLALSVAGVTQSSIGADVLREDPTDPAGVMIGSALTIRSDEFLTSTPIDIGVTATGSTATLNPLAESQAFFTQLPSGPVSSLVLFDGTALRAGTFLPDQMLVAARWWLPFLLLVLAAPAFFRAVTGSRYIGYLAAALILFSPSTAWWSFTQVEILGFALAGALGLLRAVDAWVAERRWRALGWGALAALLLARTPLYYQPWAIVLVSAVVLVAVVVAVVPAPARRRRVVAVAGVGTATAALLGAIVVENLDAISASMATLYPGERVATGGPNGFQEIFGGTNLGRLETYTTFTGTSASEISSSFAVVGVWAVLLIAHRLTYRDQAHRAAVWVLASVTAFWFAWTTVEFGALGTHIPLANLVPAGRAADILGYLCVLLLCLVLPGLPDRTGLGFSLLSAVVTAGAAANAGSLLRSQNIPEMSIRWIWGCALLLAVTVFVITYRPRRPAGYVLAGGLAFLLVWTVNPVIVGLGDLRGTPVADQMLDEGKAARAEGDVWATDAYATDSLLIATGVPSLSGRQMSGPRTEAWEALDPDGLYETEWNRGGSYVWVVWTDEDTLTMSNPSPDVILVSTSPCVLAERSPDLSQVVSSRELDASCLVEERTFDWGGATRWVYSVTP